MAFDAGPRSSRPPGRRWMVRLFETSDKLEEHLNRSNLRPDQVASIAIDAEGFFVLVYWVGGGPPEGERRFARVRDEEPRPRPRPAYEDDESGFRGGPRPGEYTGPPRRGGREFDRDRGGFEPDAPPRRDFPPRRAPRRDR